MSIFNGGSATDGVWASSSDVDFYIDGDMVHVGETKVCLAAEGLYALQLPLPRTVDADRARCRFDKKKRVLTVTMPHAA